MFIGVWLKGRTLLLRGRSPREKIRYLNTTSEDTGDPLPDNFVMFFENVEKNRSYIYNSLRNKSGVYMLINNITNDFYIGSSINLTSRMTNHFYHAKSETKGKTIVNRAMNKYKLKNFSLGILEFCIKDPIVCTKLEQN